MPVGGVPKYLVLTLTRSKFKQLCQDLIKACMAPCRQALSYTGLQSNEIEFLAKKPSKGVNPHEVVTVFCFYSKWCLNW